MRNIAARPGNEKKSVFEGRSTRCFQSQLDVFSLVSDWAARNHYELINSAPWFGLYCKKKAMSQRFLGCAYVDGNYTIEAWLTFTGAMPNQSGMPQETILEMSAVGVGEPQKKPARKEVNELLRALGVAPIGKLKGFYWR